MGANMVRRLMRGGHQAAVYDRSPQAIETLAKEGAAGAASLAALVSTLATPRHLFLMVPAAYVEQSIAELVPLLAPGDTIIDGGNSNYQDDIARARLLAAKGLHHVDMGTSGGVWGLERGYCLMIGGEKAVVEHLSPVFAGLAPGKGNVPVTASRPEKTGSTADQGYLHCGPHGAGHFVKMVHNGIEYGLMAAYSEGLNILRNADIGLRPHEADAETTPLQHPEHYQYNFDLPEIAEVWRRGSVISSWLLDLTTDALYEDPALASYEGHVSDSGEGRWTVMAAIDEAVPTPVLSAALQERFSSRGNAEFANKILSAMRSEFGGHAEKKPRG
jgi:6-phosphogluconate dehydrogenase